MKLLLGLDIGTTAMKIALFDRTGALLAVSTQEYDLLTPAPNYVEEKPEVYWDAFCTGLKDIKSRYTIAKDAQISLAMSAQGETIFFLDKDGRPLRNAIVWMDNRAVREAEMLKEAYEKGYAMYRKLFSDLTECFEKM